MAAGDEPRRWFGGTLGGYLTIIAVALVVAVAAYARVNEWWIWGDSDRYDHQACIEASLADMEAGGEPYECEPP